MVFFFLLSLAVVYTWRHFNFIYIYIWHSFSNVYVCGTLVDGRAWVFKKLFCALRFISDVHGVEKEIQVSSSFGYKGNIASGRSKKIYLYNPTR